MKKIITIAITALLAVGLSGCKSEYEKCMDEPVPLGQTIDYYMNITDLCEHLR
jgi:hypothetical protein